MGAGDFSISSSHASGSPSKSSTTSVGSGYKAGGGTKGRAVRPPVSFTTARPKQAAKRVKEESEDENDGDAGAWGSKSPGSSKKRRLFAQRSDHDGDSDGDGEGLSANRSRRASSEKNKVPAYAGGDDEEESEDVGGVMEEDSGDEYAEEV